MRNLDDSVNIGCFGVGTAEKEFFVRAVNKGFNNGADSCAVQLKGDLHLLTHEPVKSLLGGFRIDCVRHGGGRCAVLGGIGECAHPVERMFRHETHKLVKIRFGFAGKAEHDGCAENEPGSTAADIVRDFADVFRAAVAVHVAQHMCRDMLNRNVDIIADFRVAVHCVNKFFRDGVGIGIKHANPMQPLNFGQFFKQFTQHGFSVKVNAVCRSVLRNNGQLRDPAFCKLFSLGKKGLHGGADSAAANQRDRAISAAIVAAVRNAQICAI